ncbi:MAG: hypothetical protein LUQ44_05635 [Methanothrix sp.]|nr:hypothetical protein [Methanothrix sp.]
MMCLLSVSQIIEIKPTGAQESSQITSITLNGANPISMPNLGIGTNWTYPYDQVPVLRENQSINGILSGAKDSAVEICIDQLSVTELLKSSPAMKRHNCSGPSVKLNQTHEAGFTLPGINSGIYTLSAFNGSGALLTALYILIGRENLSLQLPESTAAGEPLKVKANITLKNHNQSLISGAIMISADDYRNISLNLTSKRTGTGYNSTLSLGNRSAQLPEFSHISLDLAMRLLYLLPSNSAVGIQESQQSETEIFMITDETWPKGEYILTYAIYSRQEGLLGIKQQKIMVT